MTTEATETRTTVTTPTIRIEVVEIRYRPSGPSASPVVIETTGEELPESRPSVAKTHGADNVVPLRRTGSAG